MNEARPLFPERQPGPTADDVHSEFVETARAIAKICATRALLLIAVVTGAAIWGFTCWEPERDRLYVAIAFSIVFVLPLAALYYRRG